VKIEDFDRKWSGVMFPDYLKGWMCAGGNLNLPYLGFCCSEVEIDDARYGFKLTIEHNRHGDCGGRKFVRIVRLECVDTAGVHLDEEASVWLLDCYFSKQDQ